MLLVDVEFSDSAQALESQRHTLVQEATTEMMRTDTDNAGILSLQFNRLQAEGQFDEFPHSQPELMQYLERPNAEGAQFRSLLEETRIANARIAPEVTHLRAREAQLVTKVSTIQNQETELITKTVAKSSPGKCSGQCSCNQFLITNNSMNTQTEDLTQLLQKSNIEIGCLRAKAF